jgi:hypothetical protein
MGLVGHEFTWGRLPVVVVGMALQAGYRSREPQFIFGGRTYAMAALEARERF